MPVQLYSATIGGALSGMSAAIAAPHGAAAKMAKAARIRFMRAPISIFRCRHSIRRTAKDCHLSATPSSKMQRPSVALRAPDLTRARRLAFERPMADTSNGKSRRRVLDLDDRKFV